MANKNRNGNGKDTKEIVENGKAKGFMTYDEVNESLPADVSVDQMDDVMGVLGDEIAMACAARADPERHRHRFRGSGRLVEKGRVREGKRRQVRDHRLKVQERFEPPLRNLRLIGRVLGVPAGVLEHVPQDDGRSDGSVVSEPDEGLRKPVLGREAADLLEKLVLAERRGKVERLRSLDVGGDGLRHQLVEIAAAENLQHLGDVGGTGTDVSRWKNVDGLEARELRRQPLASRST